jgi:hypothetical protein
MNCRRRSQIPAIFGRPNILPDEAYGGRRPSTDIPLETQPYARALGRLATPALLWQEAERLLAPHFEMLQ